MAILQTGCRENFRSEALQEYFRQKEDNLAEEIYVLFEETTYKYLLFIEKVVGYFTEFNLIFQ